MKQRNELQPILPAIEPAIVEAIFKPEHKPSSSSKWDDFSASDALLARSALTKANRLGAAGSELRAAYLEGVADTHAALLRQTLLNDVQKHFDPAKGLEEIHNEI
jgi:hypothetical protein